MNLSAIQLVQPIAPEQHALRVVTARVGRLALVYLAIACAGALGAFLITLLAHVGLAILVAGIIVGLVPIALSGITLRVGSHLIPLFPVFQMRASFNDAVARYEQRREHEVRHFPAPLWRLYVLLWRPAAFVLVVYAAWMGLRECALAFRVGVMVGLSVSSVVILALQIIREFRALHREHRSRDDR